MGTTDIQAVTAARATAPPAGHGGDGKATAAGDDGFALFGQDGFTFGDFLDIVNPLQHIPIVSAIYRHLTGDAIDPGSRLAGGALFGGAIGVALAGLNVAVEDATGKDIGENVAALFAGDGAAPPATAVAEAKAAAPPAAAPPVPDLAQLGPLPPLPTAVAAPDPPPAAVPAETPLVVADLAALGPLPPLAARPTPGVAAILAAAESRSATPAKTANPQREEAAEWGRAAKRAAEQPEPGPRPPGAVTAEGGWFTQTMLSALEKYQEAARLGEIDRQTAAAP